MQDCKLLSQGDWHFQHREQPTLLSQTSFLTLNSDFKFILIATINKTIKLLTIEGRLVFNNGSTVYINIGHQLFIHQFLNKKFDPIAKKVIFSIDQTSETLTFSGKISQINDLESANRFIKICQEVIHRRKKCILCVLAIIGVPLDYENALMRKILIEKKKLKNKLQELLKKSNEKGYQESQEMLVEEVKSNEDGGVILFGKETDYQLKQLMQEQNQKPKILEGGYFTIKAIPYVVRNKRTQETVSRRLVIKTLKQQRKKQDSSSSSNRLKMRKQMQIINNIKNKKYLIRYYCDSESIENINEIYMDQYEHSLQEYVHYLGESLDFLQKINISKQVVQAILTIHQSGVIHRDIKPANFLIDDSNSNPNDHKVKIIDFAESYSTQAKNQLYASIDYACSHPYSPLECIDRKGFTENGPMEGIGRKQIDYWSVGITIYEIFFRKLPVSFSRAFLADITTTWKSELLVAVNQREKIGFNLVQDIINIICVKMMKFSQDQRMKLTTTKRILEALEAYIKNLQQIVEETALFD